jgi:predicted DCC family thiol-disulfide oxidoreductase YuxK
MTETTKNPILLFDGVCNLCVGSVQFYLKHDRKGVLKFSSLQSNFGKRQLKEFNIPKHVDSLILISNGKAYFYSSAALRGIGFLGGIWPVIKIFLILPSFIRDFIYQWIAKNRYRWFGKKETCWLPTPELRRRFIEN